MARRWRNTSKPLESTRRPGRGDREARGKVRNGRDTRSRERDGEHGRSRSLSACGTHTRRMGSRHIQGKSHRRRRLQIILCRPGVASVIRGCVRTHIEARLHILVRAQSPLSIGWIPRGFRGSAVRQDVGETSCPKVHRIVDTPARRVTYPVSGQGREQ